jgi:hypothetical protein
MCRPPEAANIEANVIGSKLRVQGSGFKGYKLNSNSGNIGVFSPFSNFEISIEKALYHQFFSGNFAGIGNSVSFV